MIISRAYPGRVWHRTKTYMLTSSSGVSVSTKTPTEGGGIHCPVCIQQKSTQKVKLHNMINLCNQLHPTIQLIYLEEPCLSSSVLWKISSIIEYMCRAQS